MPDIYRTRKRVCTLPVSTPQTTQAASTQEETNHSNSTSVWNGHGDGPSNSIGVYGLDYNILIWVKFRTGFSMYSGFSILKEVLCL